MLSQCVFRYIHAILRLTPKHFWECQIPLFKFRNNFMAQKIIFNQFFRPFASTFFFARVDFWPFWGAQQECSPKAKKPHRIMFFLKIEIFMFNLFYQTLEPRKKTPPSILSTLGSLFGPIFCPNFKKSAHTRYRRNSKHV